MPTGTITRFFQQRGFGYITPDNNDGHYVVLMDDFSTSDVRLLPEGTRVRFEEANADHGLHATNVRFLEDPDH